ncbi:hypothetical protein ACSBR1_021001 [Camellia fascicularis]
MSSSVAPPLLFFSFSFLLSIFSCSSDDTTFKGIDLENPVIDVTPSPLTAYTSFSHGSKDVLLCERVRVAGQSRLELGSYASAYQVKLVPSAVIPERLHNKIQICFHQNASRGLCQCETDEWKTVHNELWSSVMSPYEDRYVDVKFVDKIAGYVTVTVDKEFQRWRLFCLAFGFVLLLLAPVVSSWVPFYYTVQWLLEFSCHYYPSFSADEIITNWEEKCLLPHFIWIGAWSWFLPVTSLFNVGPFNSILVSFGLSEEMHNPVSIFVLLGIVVAGAAVGYWMVRKFVIAEDGSVDVGVAQFVKWAMRVIAATFILSTLDTLLAMGALASCLSICFLITSFKWNGPDSTITFGNSIYSANGNPWRGRGQTNVRQNRAEFLSRSGMVASRGTLWNSPRRPSGWSDSPVKGMISLTTGRVTKNQQDYFSTFHRTPNRKKFSKKEWENFTQESTRHAVAELASFPKFTDWIIKHADRIQLLPDDSSDNTIGSGSDSTDENLVESGDRFSLCKW